MRRVILLIFLLAPLVVMPAAEKPGVKVFISVDMEGICGVVHADQTTAGTPDYNAARQWMAEDVNAVVRGLLEAGATEIVVNDSHGSMRNIIPDDLLPAAALISGTPKPLSMMAGIDSSFQACVFIGYHARAGTPDAVLDHTISGGNVHSIRVNGLEMPELGLNAAIAGCFDVPVIMLSGDNAVCGQARAMLGDRLTTVAVKEAIGRNAARLVPFSEARKQLQQSAREALLKYKQGIPFKPKPPFTFELSFLNSGMAETGELLPMVKRVDGRRLRFTTGDYLEGFKILRALIALASAR